MTKQWSVCCFTLVGQQLERIKLEVDEIEPFSPKGRVRIRVSTNLDLQDINLLFTVVDTTGDPVTIMPVVTPHVLNSPIVVRKEYLSCKRLVTFPTAQLEYLVCESSAYLGIGGKIWDASLTLLEYLCCNGQQENRWKELFPNAKLVVDLGSATGVLGCGLALLHPGITVCNTDLPEVVPLLEETAKQLNQSNVKTFAYTWGKRFPQEMNVVDVLLLADVVYEELCQAPLLQSIREIHPKQVLIAHRNRNANEHLFFQQLSDLGTVELLKRPQGKLLLDNLDAVLGTFIDNSTTTTTTSVRGMDDVIILKVTL